ncbi:MULTISPECIES: type IV pilus modification protein PilV [Acinetobacter]|uniref:Type IV pilus modification protein PilV n=1 Tax=Acinetobacter piscicola TaxID=2006115 RepID=A0A7S6VYZ4_9GAMM|nr:MULTISPECIES: type IV pilus modification protein PilV [Acinetobacter]MDM1756728.1 type IV pilus modification protein PilV [Acinetobacter sp. 256-1]MDM1761962.1 type IV pilus modification protein PilV [Acinetobacter sp. 251-1]QOW47468.1 type IV pilus modification protein PilV [Acinetobacter piscicola]
MNLQIQKGVGLIEVIVALVILVIAVLGFVALQVRAIEASQDSVFKTQAVHLMQSLSESIRVNNTAKANYVTDVNTYLLASSKPTATVNCNTTVCTPAQLSTFESYAIARQAAIQGLSLGIATCPGIATNTPVADRRLCIFSVWKDTTLTGTAANLNVTSCMSNTGVYVASSNCLMMESY